MTQGSTTSFSVSYDLTAKIISGLVALGFIAAIVIAKSLLLACLSLFLISVAFAYSPRGYVVAEGSIIIRRLAKDAQVALESVKEARTAVQDDLHGLVRLWGSGGLFGYYGLHRTRKLGRSTWYVTNRSKMVVLDTGAKRVLLSPDDPDAFVKAVRAVAPSTEAPAGVPSFESVSLFPVDKLIGIAVAALVVAVLAVVFFWAPGPPAYTLTSDALTIQDRFYPVTLRASEVDVEHIRVVDVSTDPEWRPTARTNGFGIKHYASGWFRVVSGRTVRMYRADANRLVLLPPAGEGAAVLYGVSEPESFIEKVRQAWGKRAYLP